MAKDREIQCKYYEFEGKCKKGRGGRFRKTCQFCNLYSPVKGKQPARRNLKRIKKEKFENDKRNWE